MLSILFYTTILKTMVFDSTIIHSFDRVQSFLAGREAIGEILSFKSAKTHVLNDCWTVAWIHIKAPFDYIFSAFLQAIAALLDCLGAGELSKRCALLSRHVLADQTRLAFHQDHGENYLASCVNAHQLAASDFYLSPPIPVMSIRDERVRRCIYKEKSEIGFYHDLGVCRGISDWFCYLYLMTAESFDDPIAHLQAVSEQFKEGAPREAALLHSFNASEALLDLHAAEYRGEPLPCGIYAVNLERHRMNYIKCGQELHFLFNPEGGLIRLRNADAVMSYIREKSNGFPYWLERITLARAADVKRAG